MSTGYAKPPLYAWIVTKQYFINKFEAFWQLQTYQRLCYFLLAIPMGLAYCLGLLIGILMPVTLLYLAMIRYGLLSSLFFAALLLGFLMGWLSLIYVKILLRLERSLARKFIGLLQVSQVRKQFPDIGIHQHSGFGSRTIRALKQMFYLSIRIPMGFSNLILILVSMVLTVLMLLAPWLYTTSSFEAVFYSAAIDTTAEAFFLMLLALPLILVILKGLGTLALIQGRFTNFMLTSDSI